MPDDQKALVETVQQLSEQYGFELNIVDVTKEDFFNRTLLKLKGIKNLPVVEFNRGGRLQTPFSQSELERFVSESNR